MLAKFSVLDVQWRTGKTWSEPTAQSGEKCRQNEIKINYKYN